MSETAPKKKKRRVYLWVLGSVVVLLLAVVLIVPALIDAEAFRPQVERVLRDTTGWDAELGELDFSLLRGAIGVSPVGLTAPGGTTSKLDVGRIDVEVGLFALLRKELRVESVRLVQPEILLVRPDEATGWVVPVAQHGKGEPASSGGTARADAGRDAGEAGGAKPGKPRQGRMGIAVVIDEIAVRGGKLRFEDRAVRPAMTFEMNDVSATFYPQDAGIRGELTFGEDDGRASWRGQVGKTVEVTLDGVKTELLQAFLGEELVHAGGELSGEITLAFPLRLEGSLDARGLTLIAGERPFDEAGVDFAVAPADLGWNLETLEFHGDGARLVGGGPLTPTLALKLELPDTELDAALRASQSVLPLPLDISAPGSVVATILVDQPDGGELTFEARGSLSAAEVRPGGTLPAAKDVRATFVLDRAGRVDVVVESATIAGGPARGKATIHSIDPPGKMTFSGGLQDAMFGDLLGGLVAEAKPVRGPTGFNATLGIDLTREVLDARSLSGRLDFGARELTMPGWDLDRAMRGKLEEKAASGAAGLLKELLDKKDAPKTEVAAEEVVEAVSQLIDSLEGTVDMDRWPWGIENVRLGVGDVAATGDGWFDPEQGSVDFTLTSRLDAVASRKLIDKHKMLRALADPQGRITLPVRVRGTLLAPSIKVDVSKALTENVDAGKAKKDDEVKGLLKGLLEKKLKKD